MDRLTIEQLIAKKREKEATEAKYKDIDIPSYGGSLLFNKPSDDVVLGVMGEMTDENDMTKTDEAFKELIYKCCPTLQDKQLHQAFEITDPLDIVKTLFNVGDRFKLGNKLLKMAGLSDLNETVKN